MLKYWLLKASMYRQELHCLFWTTLCSAPQLHRLSQGVVIFYLSAKDERGAIKSASDRLRVWKASGGVFDAASTAGLPNPALTPLCAYLEEPDDVS